MTSLERMDAFSKGKPYDRIPCCPFLGESCAPLFGHSIKDHNFKIEAIIDTAIGSYNLFKPDGISTGPGLQGIPEAMGTTIDFRENSTPAFKKAAIESIDDVHKLKIIDPYKDGRVGLFLEALKVIKDKLSGKVGVGTTLGGPFTIAAFLIGTEKFLKDIILQPDEKIHKLMNIATENALAYIDAACAIGLVPGIADPIASSTMISQRVFAKYAKPYLKICVDRIYELTGQRPTLHICGKTEKVWKDMVETGIANLSLDNEDDLEKLKKLHGNDVCIIGNVDPVKTILMGTKEEIFLETKKCIEKGKNSPKGHILATGCDVPIGTPIENIQNFVDAARYYGRN